MKERNVKVRIMQKQTGWIFINKIIFRFYFVLIIISFFSCKNSDIKPNPRLLRDTQKVLQPNHKTSLKLINLEDIARIRCVAFHRAAANGCVLRWTPGPFPAPMFAPITCPELQTIAEQVARDLGYNVSAYRAIVYRLTERIAFHNDKFAYKVLFSPWSLGFCTQVKNNPAANPQCSPAWQKIVQLNNGNQYVVSGFSNTDALVVRNINSNIITSNDAQTAAAIAVTAKTIIERSSTLDAETVGSDFCTNNQNALWIVLTDVSVQNPIQKLSQQMIGNQSVDQLSSTLDPLLGGLGSSQTIETALKSVQTYTSAGRNSIGRQVFLDLLQSNSITVQGTLIDKASSAGAIISSVTDAAQVIAIFLTIAEAEDRLNLISSAFRNTNVSKCGPLIGLIENNLEGSIAFQTGGKFLFDQVYPKIITAAAQAAGPFGVGSVIAGRDYADALWDVNLEPTQAFVCGIIGQEIQRRINTWGLSPLSETNIIETARLLKMYDYLMLEGWGAVKQLQDKCTISTIQFVTGQWGTHQQYEKQYNVTDSLYLSIDNIWSSIQSKLTKRHVQFRQIKSPMTNRI